jgi:hypothetical protein
MDQIEVIQCKIDEVEASIAAKQIGIDQAQAALKESDDAAKLSPSEDATADVKFKRGYLMALITEKEQLRTKEEQLRKEKEKLLDLQILQMQQQRITEVDPTLKEPAGTEPVELTNTEPIVWNAHSPSSMKSVLTMGMAIVEEDMPVFWELHAADMKAAAVFAEFCKAADRSTSASGSMSEQAKHTREPFEEKKIYGIAEVFRPQWSSAVATPSPSPNAKTARNLYERSFTMMPMLDSCQPELWLRCKEKCVPGFNAELKTMGNKGLFDGAATYVALDMLRSFFSKWDSGAASPCGENHMLYYDRPPLGYAICGAPPVGWVVAIEWIGRLFISAYSRPFFLGSEEHKAVIAGLEKPEFREPLDLTSELSKGIWQFVGPRSEGSKVKHTSWTKVPAHGCVFYKIKTWDAVLPQFQKRAALAYAAYNKALDAKSDPDPPPEALVRASLHFGCARLAVRMPFIRGTSPSQGELSSEDGTSRLAVSISKALLWLAAHDLLYTDLRPPNVLVLPSGGVRLVDYDDMRIVPGLGANVESQGVDALTAAFAIGPRGETDFTRYPGIRAALAADLSAERGAKRARHAAGGAAQPPPPAG